MADLKFYTDFFTRGDDVLIRGYDAAGTSCLVRHQMPLVFYSETGKHLSEFKTIEGRRLYHVNFSSLKDARQIAKESKLYGNLKAEYTAIDQLFPALEVDEQKIKTAFIDIETESEHGFPQTENPIEAVNCVSVVCGDETYLITTLKADINDPSIQASVVEDERSLFVALAAVLKTLEPDVISGWSVRYFDVPYLVARSKHLFGDLKWARSLSPWGILNETESFEVDGIEYEFAGITVLDYIDLYKKYGKKQPNYRLDSVVEDELKDNKIPHDGTFKDWYSKNPTEFCLYNVKDARLVKRLDDKLHYLGLVFMLAYQSKVKYRDTYMQIRMWETMIYNKLRHAGIQAPCKVGGKSSDSQYEGAYVTDPIPGMYHWVATFDAKSLYPSLMQTYNISPETFIEKQDLSFEDYSTGKFDRAKLVEQDRTLAANGAMFCRETEGLIPGMLRELQVKRDAAKQEMLGIERQLEEIAVELKRREV